jgi:4-amino-4-deoxy-L-arabinose transferase-like glycosyltransferase
MVSMTRRETLTPWRAALALVGLLTALRLVVLFVTPLQLYPDEAQYWLWSRTLDFGYYSKPPMVAWLIALTTAIGGDSEPWVRLSALWLHAGAALALYGAGSRLYDEWTGFWAAALYSLMPGVQLSAGVIATDAPMLFFLSLALWAYVALLQGRSNLAALALGAALGGATLSKYAALYFAAGLIAHALWSRAGRGAWSRGRLALALLALAVVLGPNLLWNARHGFATVSHTAANADWDAAERFQVAEALDFLGSQFGVFGPLPFLVLLAGAVALALRRRLDRADLLLLGFVLPPLLIVTAQAFITRANANWAAAAYAPASVLVAAWLVRWRAKRTLAATAAIQGAIAGVFLLCAAVPAVADALGVSNSFKRARGWRETTEIVLERVRREPSLTAVAVDDRFYFNALAYYGRAAWPSGPPLRIWVREIAPQNQAETTDPLTAAQGGRVLAVSGVADYREEIKADFARTAGAQDGTVVLGPDRTRAFQLFVGERFAPRPRDPATGRPTAP